MPVEALIWIPGVVQIAFVPDATILSVELLFWSIYMSVVSGGSLLAFHSTCRSFAWIVLVGLVGVSGCCHAVAQSRRYHRDPELKDFFLSSVYASQLHAFLGVLAPEWRPYVNFFKAIRRYIGYAVWALVNWISFEQLIDNQGNSDKSEGDGKVTSEMSTAWFGFWVSFAILAAEKLAIQVIAHNYHERAFADVSCPRLWLHAPVLD